MTMLGDKDLLAGKTREFRTSDSEFNLIFIAVSARKTQLEQTYGLVKKFSDLLLVPELEEDIANHKAVLHMLCRGKHVYGGAHE